MKRLTSYVPAGYLGTKRMGELAELGFMYRAASHGFGVARPPTATATPTIFFCNMEGVCFASR